ncbi:ABC transporter permease [Caldicellulosiruptor acetigenus]|uniref:ABC transporter permease n=1 Tax=Caldicellulosiruptor acetigenus TaxID=301953 RepID=UPI0003FB88A2|nr:ABC transporter permease [Caldicellulosiruptor acetigenus]WAM36158.1 ABC transporter permease [Caldicellulosiruptor acetigenus]
MPIFKVNIKRLLQDKLNLFLTIVLPAIIIVLSVAFASNIESPYKVGIVVEEENSISKIIKSELQKCFDVVVFSKDKSIVSQMIQTGVDCAIVLDKNIEDAMLSRKNIKLKIYALGKSEAHVYLKEYLTSVFKMILSQNFSSKAELLNVAKSLSTSSPKVISKKLVENSKYISISFASGFFVMSLFWLALNASSVLLKDYHEKVIIRILCSPLSKQNYIFQSILSIFAVTFVQLCLFVGISKYVFNLTFGSNPAIVILVLSLCSFMFVSFSVMFISTVSDIKKLSSLNSMVVTIMCMLGGCYWPLSIMPKFLQKIALIFPTTYAVNLTKNVLTGKFIESMMVDIALVAAFCLFFALAGIKQLSKNVISKL